MSRRWTSRCSVSPAAKPAAWQRLPRSGCRRFTAGPNLHVHTREDELFFVIGVMTAQVGEQLREIAAAGLAWAARGTPHAFANRAADPLRIMIMWIPGGAEELFQDMRD